MAQHIRREDMARIRRDLVRERAVRQAGDGAESARRADRLLERLIALVRASRRRA